MKFKEFVNWCNDRACDGHWSSSTAIFCIDIVCGIRKKPFWSREKEWKKVSELIINGIVNPINERIVEWENESKNHLGNQD